MCVTRSRCFSIRIWMQLINIQHLWTKFYLLPLLAHSQRMQKKKQIISKSRFIWLYVTHSHNLICISLCSCMDTIRIRPFTQCQSKPTEIESCYTKCSKMNDQQRIELWGIYVSTAYIYTYSLNMAWHDMIIPGTGFDFVECDVISLNYIITLLFLLKYMLMKYFDAKFE